MLGYRLERAVFRYAAAAIIGICSAIHRKLRCLWYDFRALMGASGGVVVGVFFFRRV
jgi:hypothetical protein